MVTETYWVLWCAPESRAFSSWSLACCTLCETLLDWRRRVHCDSRIHLPLWPDIIKPRELTGTGASPRWVNTRLSVILLLSVERQGARPIEEASITLSCQAPRQALAIWSEVSFKNFDIFDVLCRKVWFGCELTRRAGVLPTIKFYGTEGFASCFPCWVGACPRRRDPVYTWFEYVRSRAQCYCPTAVGACPTPMLFAPFYPTASSGCCSSPFAQARRTKQDKNAVFPRSVIELDVQLRH